MSEIVVVFYLAGDKDICTVADGKRHQESAGAATQCNSLYFPPEEFVMSETPYFEGFLYPFQEFKFCLRYFQFANDTGSGLWP